MSRQVKTSFWCLSCVVVGVVLVAQAQSHTPKSLPLDSTKGLELVNATAKAVTYRGRRAVQLIPPEDQKNSDSSMMAIVAGSDFHDGTIELEVAGAPRAGASPDMRGFIGITFRSQPGGSPAEYFYLRPTNARSDDQERRNHTVQYMSAPDYPWQRLRKESPGVYESYADMAAGAWTKMKIVVSGTHAQLYVNDAGQPCLVVNDLKLGDSHGQIALWAHSTTEAYFSNLSVK